MSTITLAPEISTQPEPGLIMSPTIHSVIDTYDPITLQEMDDVKLLDRTEVKYFFSAKMLPEVLKTISSNYRVLDINGTRINNYETLYFDTEDFQMYLNHQSGRRNRYKIRFRKYVDSNLCFFEIKFKNSKGRTIKERIKCSDIPASISDKAAAFLSEKTPYSSTQLVPKVCNRCAS